MLSVKVIKPFKRRGEIIPPGIIIEVPDDILPKLAGYVKPIDYVATLAKSRFGQDIMVCTAHPPPAEAIKEAVAAGLPLFTIAELDTLRDCDEEALHSAIQVKLTFSGGTVIDYLTHH